MKKLLLALTATMFISFNVFANSITIINNTNCTYDISSQIGLTLILPNSTYTDSNVNGIFGAKITSQGTPGQVNVGAWPPTYPFYQSVNSATVGSFPSCNGGNSFTVVWNVDAFNDIILLILP